MRRIIVTGAPSSLDEAPITTCRHRSQSRPAVTRAGRSQRPRKASALAPASSDHHANVLSNTSVRSYEATLPKLAALSVSFFGWTGGAGSSAIKRALSPMLEIGPTGVKSFLARRTLVDWRGRSEHKAAGWSPACQNPGRPTWTRILVVRVRQLLRIARMDRQPVRLPLLE